VKIKESEIPPLDMPPEEAWARLMGPRPPHVPEDLWAEGEAKMTAFLTIVQPAEKPPNAAVAGRALREVLGVMTRIAFCGGKSTFRARATFLREIVGAALRRDDDLRSHRRGPPH
jgi:hypothetical protein